MRLELPRFGLRPALPILLAGLVAAAFFPAEAQQWPEGFRLAGGAGHALLIREGGQLWGFGTNQSAALGAETRDFPDYLTNRLISYRIGSQNDWRWIEASGDEAAATFAIRSGGGLWSWGDNRFGQLGDGTGQSRKTPSWIAAGQAWRTVSARDGSVFAVRRDGTLWAWGRNDPGTGTLGIGRGRARLQLSPVRVGSKADWRNVQASRGTVVVVTNLEQYSITNNEGVVTNILTNVVRTLAAGKGGAGIRGNGEIWAWGSTFARVVPGSNGAVTAVSTSFTPRRIGNEAGWKQVIFAHATFALKTDGSLWIYNDVDQGLDAFPSDTNPVHRGWKILRGAQTGEGASARGHLVGVKKDGTLWAWGDNRESQVDASLDAELPQNVPWQITGLDGVKDNGWSDAVAGPGYSVAVTQAGQVFTWGSIGLAPPAIQRKPLRIRLTENPRLSWRDALAGADFTLGVGRDGSLYGWGFTGLSDPAKVMARTPELLEDGADLEDPLWSGSRWTRGVAVMGRVIAAIDSSRRMKEWGDSEETDFSLPWWNPLRAEDNIRNFGSGWAQVTGNRGFTGPNNLTNSGASLGAFAAAVRRDGSLLTWGDNALGQLGDGTKIPQDTPRRIPGTARWSKAAAGGSHMVGIQRDGSVWGWGDNSSGQLGLTTNVVTIRNFFSGGTNSTNSNNVSPRVYAGRIQTTQVLLASNVLRPGLILEPGWGARDVAAGGAHTLILRNDGTLWAMGTNGQGQLGLGETPRPDATTSLTDLRRSNSVTNVITNISFAPWRVETNIDTTLDQAWMYRPFQVGSDRWKSISAGQRHSLAVRADGTLWAWGDNTSGQLGNGTLVSAKQPVQVGRANRWVRAFAGKEHSLALQKDGSLWVWGKNDGRLGLGQLTNTVPAMQEVTFGRNGQGTLILESEGWGKRRMRGTGLVNFQTRDSSLRLTFQLERIEWSGIGAYTASPRALTFSNLSAAPAGEGGGDRPASGPATNSRFKMEELNSSWFRPGVYQGSAKVDGAPFRATLLLDGDSDRDGIPDLADRQPLGARPTLSASLRTRGKVNQSFEYNIPGLSGGVTPILSSNLSALPPGLKYGDKKIEGRPTRNAVGIHEVVFGAANLAGSSYQTLTIEVLPPDPRLQQTNERVTWVQGNRNSRHKIRMREPAIRGFPLEFQASNLPAGVVLDPATGILRPTLRLNFWGPNPGTYRIPVVVSHRGGGIGRGMVILAVQPAEPALAPPAEAERNQKFSGSGQPDGWSQPSIFSIGPVASRTLLPGGQARDLAAGVAARNYRLLWTNVEGWEWDVPEAGMAQRLKHEEVSRRQAERQEIRRFAPTGLRLARITHVAGRPGIFLPTNHIFWLKGPGGSPIPRAERPGEWLVDFSHPEFLQRLEERVGFLVRNGCVDGVYLSEWDEAGRWPSDSTPEKAKAGDGQAGALLPLLQILRRAVGPQGWIMAEGAGNTWTRTGPWLDGIHLVAATEPPPAWPPVEGWWPDPYLLREKEGAPTLWQRLVHSLQYFGQTGVLRKPGMVAIELWARHDLRDARTKQPRLAGLAMSLCLSDGAYLYARPDWWKENGNAVASGEHLWFPEWNLRLGRALESRRSLTDPKGFYRRQFENGWAVYAPPSSGPALKIEFTESVESVATGKTGRVHKLPPGQGDLYLKKR